MDEIKNFLKKDLITLNGFSVTVGMILVVIVVFYLVKLR
jgi:hypothetical protein